MNKLLERISIDSEVCGGKPCIKSTRIWVSLLLDLLADGMTEPDLLAEYPQLVHEDVLAAIAYGAEPRARAHCALAYRAAYQSLLQPMSG
ncbi:MAG TPA: DUF433 domain-containing protein [Xanthobacteraceae bacterium]|jgi:uncharacterized protein (DUF433 family)